MFLNNECLSPSFHCEGYVKTKRLSYIVVHMYETIECVIQCNHLVSTREFYHKNR